MHRAIVASASRRVTRCSSTTGCCARWWRSSSSSSSSSVSSASNGGGGGQSSAEGMKAEDKYELLMRMCKQRGFMYPGSEIYGGLSNAFDYGPLGVQLKKNVQDAWWRDFVERRRDCVGLDTSIVMSPKVWEASGHTEHFSDPLVDCSTCHHRSRVDKLLEDVLTAAGLPEKAQQAASLSLEDMGAALLEHNVACPHCGKETLTKPTVFNLMFQTQVGPASTTAATTYLRPETAQGAYVQFANVRTTSRKQLPFGIGQVGKAFRNEISPGHFLFRAREFELMELQYMTHPEESAKWHRYWIDECYSWLLAHGLSPDNVRQRTYPKEELAHYALDTTDLEFKYWFGWGELWGIANRGSYDLENHSKASGIELNMQDVNNPKQKLFPHVIEPAIGLGRLVLALLYDALCVEEVEQPNGKTQARTVLRLNDELAPFQAAVVPLLRKEAFLEAAEALHSRLAAHGCVDYDSAGSVGKRYRRQDEIGTPVCVTVDHQTLEDGTVTLRCRDSMEQTRVHMDDLSKGPIKRSEFF